VGKKLGRRCDNNPTRGQFNWNKENDVKKDIEAAVKLQVIPRLKFCNGFLLVVMGETLPITARQARVIYGQLRSMQEEMIRG